MPTTMPHDQSLNRLLSELVSLLAASAEGRMRLGPDDLGETPSDAVDVLCAAGLLSPAEPARGTLCEGCERGCPMEVQFATAPGGAKAAFIDCDRRDDIGRVPVDTATLRRWQLSLDRIASTTAALLGADGPVEPLPGGLSWDLGEMVQGNRRLEVRLAPALNAAAPFAGLTVSLTALPSESDARAIEINKLVRFEAGRLVVDDSALARALAWRPAADRVACEVVHEQGHVVLVNHVTGTRRVLANPNFNSINDNAFQVLYDNPGRRYALKELRDACSASRMADLHKVVEGLNFKGPLKQLFFRVSKSSIQFERQATFGTLANLGIDPSQIT